MSFWEYLPLIVLGLIILFVYFFVIRGDCFPMMSNREKKDFEKFLAEEKRRKNVGK